MSQLKETTKSINKTNLVCNSYKKAQQLQNITVLDMKDLNFGQKLIENFRKIGFVIVQNHGMSKQLIDMAFAKSKEVFQMPKDVKQNIAIRVKQLTSRGYTGPFEEILDQNKYNEKKQTFDLGHPDGPGELKFYPKNPDFVNVSRIIYQKLFEVYKKVMASMEIGLHLQPGTITEKCCKDFYDQTMRYLYYPQISIQQLHQQGKGRCGAHSDYGTVTLLLQKPGFGQNGLRIFSSKKQWLKLNPPDYSMVINLGDLFQHWTNEKLVSTIHKVQVDDEIYEQLQKNSLKKIPARQTIVLFCDSDKGQILECLPGCGQPKYQPINGKQYVFGRLKATQGQKDNEKYDNHA